MEGRSYVLDIGIGNGGRYINDDGQNNFFRIGFDQRSHNLTYVKDHYGIA